MAEKEWYKDWFNSPFYHKLYFERDEKEAETFIKRLIEHLHPHPGSRMLDVACGRGRHSRILASMGFQVTGIDLSPDSIAFAKQYVRKDSFREADNLEFYVHDMRSLFHANYFDCAFNFFTSFGYFKTRREHDDAIRSISKSLKPGGFLVIDYLNVHYAEKNIVHNEIKQIGETIYDIQRWDDETHFYKKITVTDPSLKETLTCIEKVAKFSFGDFTEMLAYQGMQVQEVFGDYQLNKYDIKNTPRLIVVAEKPGHVTTGS
ncbi:MAG: class I SAM-dependent methyltransferase [Sphingobacteriales bacterium]|nr:class I SAM-dependent methyltransferase [Sphingobacteriales bacterium]